MEKAYKFRIYPTKQQEILIQKTFGSCRFVYNQYLAKSSFIRVVYYSLYIIMGVIYACERVVCFVEACLVRD